MTIYNVPIYGYLPLLGLEDDIDADIDFSHKEYSSRKHKYSHNLRIKFMSYSTLCVLHNK